MLAVVTNTQHMHRHRLQEQEAGPTVAVVESRLEVVEVDRPEVEGERSLVEGVHTRYKCQCHIY